MYKYPLKSLSQPSLSLLTESTYNTSSRVTLGFFLPPLLSILQAASTKSGEVKDRMGRAILDYTLVPLGLVSMVAYHIWLLYRIMMHPTKTVIGINVINRRFWVRAMMEDVSKNGVLAVQTLRNNIMASTVLASTAIMLSSLIAVLMTSGSGDKSARNFVFGDRSELGLSIKFFSILVCFLVAFLLNVQSIRYYSHASILINVPFKKMCLSHRQQHLSTEYVARSVNRGSYFWSLGLRAFYFSFPLFLWIFGPIPMFLSCFFLVSTLYFLDVTLETGWAVEDEDDDVGHKDVGSQSQV